MSKFFISLYVFFERRKPLLFSVLVLIVAGLALAATQIHFREDIADFLPGNADSENINAIYEHAGNSDKLIIGFESKTGDNDIDNENITAAIDHFAHRLQEADPDGIIPEIIWQADESRFYALTDFIRANIPYFLQEADFNRFDSLIAAANIGHQIAASKQLLMFPAGDFLLKNIQSDPLQLFSPVMLHLADFGAGGGQTIIDGYIFSKNQNKGLVFVTSPFGVSETAKNQQLLNLIEATAAETQTEFQSVKTTIFGAPAIAVTNASQIKADSMLAVGIAALLILLLLLYFFRSARHLLLVFIPLLFGWLFALGVLAVARDTISAIAVGISSIFIGIAVNYPLHFIDHLRREPDKLQALREIAPPLIIGNITTTGAFLSLMFINAQAMRDLGLFGALLLVGTICFVLVFLPQIMRNSAITHTTPRFGKIADFEPEKHKFLIIAVLILTAVFAFFSTKTGFETDMNAINYMTAEQRQNMNEMLQSAEREGAETIYLVSAAKTADEVLSIHEANMPSLAKLKNSGLAESVAGIGYFLPSEAEQKNRIARWNEFWSTRRDSVLKNINYFAEKEGFKANTFDDFENILNQKFEPKKADFFAPLNILTDNYFFKTEDKNVVINLIHVNKENAEKVETILEQEAARSFVLDSRNIMQRFADALAGDFNRVLFICGLIVFVFLTISFGRAELSIMAFVPLAVSWIWILGIMYILGIEFNIVNIILATFIFGQGDDYTIFVADGLIHEYAYRHKMLAAHKQSIILSALLMFAGIGTLIFARHPALHSLAEVTIVGMGVTVMMAFVLPPVIFKYLTQKKDGFRQVPWTLKRFAVSLFAFVAFLIGSLGVTIYGFLLFGIKNNKKVNNNKVEVKKLKYHTVLCKISNFVVRHIPFVKFEFDNLSGETFESPSVIISNHQAHLDLMCLLMLHPKLIVLTNDWVWNNVFYGKLVKYADFYPVSDGIERSVDLLRSRVEQGYSVVVFPEGTRSENSEIQRFHRGAFFLAEKLNLDIVPVLLHGPGDVLPKKDFLLRQGQITVQILPRIAPTDPRFAPDYATRSKQIRMFYKEKFALMRQRNETPEYFRSFVLHQFLYKGADIYAKAKGEYEKIIADTNENLLCTDYELGNEEIGIRPFVSALIHKDLQITVKTANDKAAALLEYCAGRPQNLKIVVS
ncbi:MAG: 1-acyl-sn-glycerol-3-phosphate acyltransferase [Prevotellaceae bacterium]|jgi:1-acyl-sn-glycerol-3-phosphate acyltransferase|nr:1-acyl-sn-glycerol-3-phosphate acyltransferase [Prevotellaceae bacterium]